MGRGMQSRLQTFIQTTFGLGIAFSIAIICIWLVAAGLTFFNQGPQGVADIISRIEEGITKNSSVLLFPLGISAVYGVIAAARD